MKQKTQIIYFFILRFNLKIKFKLFYLLFINNVAKVSAMDSVMIKLHAKSTLRLGVFILQFVAYIKLVSSIDKVFRAKVTTFARFDRLPSSPSRRSNDFCVLGRLDSSTEACLACS